MRDGPQLVKWEKSLRMMCLRMGAKFVSYKVDGGVWRFEVRGPLQQPLAEGTTSEGCFVATMPGCWCTSTACLLVCKCTCAHMQAHACTCVDARTAERIARGVRFDRQASRPPSRELAACRCIRGPPCRRVRVAGLPSAAWLPCWWQQRLWPRCDLVSPRPAAPLCPCSAPLRSGQPPTSGSRRSLLLCLGLRATACAAPLCACSSLRGRDGRPPERHGQEAHMLLRPL